MSSTTPHTLESAALGAPAGRSSSALLGRRALLGTALTAAAAGVVGCQVDTGSGGSAARSSQAGKINIPDAGKPEESGTVSWLDSGDLKSVFETAVLDAYTAKYPKIKNGKASTFLRRVVMSLKEQPPLFVLSAAK